MVKNTMRGEKKKEFISRLKNAYDSDGIALNFSSPYELLVATILAAQCTDVRVNMITEGLFKKYPDAQALAEANLEELEEEIKTCGLYKSKAKNLLATANSLVNDFNGAVPKTMEELTSLAGVGRKTANVVLAFAYNIPAFPVDTHVKRVANRLGLADSDDPDAVEEDLKKFFNKSDWTHAHHWLIWHGRRVCAARKPKCGECMVKQFCRFENKETGNKNDSRQSKHND